MNPDFLEHINWFSDDGVFFPMLNDFGRNQYYDELIRHSVQGKHCVDVGFGTGLLTMMALQHGAEQVTAYETDPNRYALGCYIIEKLGLQQRINLVRECFDWRTPVPPHSVIISETVGSQLWSEGLWNSIPRQGQQTWLPGQVFMHVVAQPISKAFAQDLFRPAEHFGFFNPAVDVDPAWVEIINQLTKKQQPQREQQYHTDNHQTTVWGGWTYATWAKLRSDPCASYTVDLGSHQIEIDDAGGQKSHAVDFDAEHIELTVSLPKNQDLPVLVVPRVGFCHQTALGPKTLYLDMATSWGAGCTPLIVTARHSYVTIKHSVTSGLITYSSE